MDHYRIHWYASKYKYDDILFPIDRKSRLIVWDCYIQSQYTSIQLHKSGNYGEKLCETRHIPNSIKTSLNLLLQRQVSSIRVGVEVHFTIYKVANNYPFVPNGDSASVLD